MQKAQPMIRKGAPPGSLYQTLTDACPHCGKLHLQMPGNDSTWKCARCGAPVSRPVVGHG